jgi:hypothetical protein
VEEAADGGVALLRAKQTGEIRGDNAEGRRYQSWCSSASKRLLREIVFNSGGRNLCGGMAAGDGWHEPSLLTQ